MELSTFSKVGNIHIVSLATESISGSGEKYRKTESGLRIMSVSRSDRGAYICRARVANTGQMEEREIEVEVRSDGGGVLSGDNCIYF